MPTLTLTMPDGDAEAYLAAAPGGAPAPGVLFVIDAIGLRPRIAEMADRIASWGYTVLAPNVFHRDGTAAELAPGADLREPGAREAFMPGAMERVKGLTTDLLARDLPAYLSALRSRPETAGEDVGVTGYCMGARIAVLRCRDGPGRRRGGRLARRRPGDRRTRQPAPRPDHGAGRFRLRARLRRPVDAAEVVAALGAAMAEAGLTAVNEVFPGPHGYSMADTSMYDAESTERHFGSLRTLLGSTLAAR